MPHVLPFAAIRYDASRFQGDISALVAPPYDVLDQSEKEALLRKHPDNIVALDLPHMPPKSAGPSWRRQRPGPITRGRSVLTGRWR